MSRAEYSSCDVAGISKREWLYVDRVGLQKRAINMKTKKTKSKSPKRKRPVDNVNTNAMKEYRSELANWLKECSAWYIGHAKGARQRGSPNTYMIMYASGGALGTAAHMLGHEFTGEDVHVIKAAIAAIKERGFPPPPVI